MSARADVERDLVIVACAISAGIHAALTPAHGLAFPLAAGALAGLAVALTRRPSAPALAGAAAVFAGLLAGWALAVTTGLPILHPEAEPVTGLALCTKAVEAAGLLAAARLLGRSILPSPKGTTA